MAKKGGVQQLQTEINTNEELAKFLDRDGLIVLDVYTEWCGPCLAMIGSLKKIKLEQGGDDLHLAIVKCDKIDAFQRFRNKSEPTWLLASKGKLVDCAFGANVPHLVELILKELDTERRTRINPESSGRMYCELTEMTPVERVRYDAIQIMEEENERIELESAQRRQIEYVTFVTDEIMKNSSDLGVTLLMPHVISRDLLKRLSDPADKCHLVAKDKKNVQILRDHIEILDISATDSIPYHLVDHILNREVFAVCWKLTDSNADGDRNVEEYLSTFAHYVWNEDETTNGNNSILKALSVIIETETNDDDEMNEQSDVEAEKPVEEPKQEEKQEMELNDGKAEDSDDGNNEGGEGDVDADQSDTAANEDAPTNNSEEHPTEGERNAETTPENDETEGKSNKNDETYKSSSRTTPITPITTIKKKNKIEIKIPPIWTPLEKRTNAALIYLYFRAMTETYLPPDPPVERPHLAMIFDAYKRREIMEVIEEYRDDVLAYGYFTSDNCNTAQLIANSTFNYHKNPPTIYDKFVIKVAKTKNSPVVAALKKLGPSYVSKNTEVGKSECLLFFPPGYKNSSETGETTPVPVDEKPKKKKKKRKTKQGSDEENENNQVQNAAQAPTDVEIADEPEDGTEQDDDDSADDEDSAEGNEMENLPETTET